jgi:hypothetical protein
LPQVCIGSLACTPRCSDSKNVNLLAANPAGVSLGPILVVSTSSEHLLFRSRQ